MSPYENRLRSESFRRVGLISLIRPGQESVVETRLASAPSPDSAPWATLGLSQVTLHQQIGPSHRFLFTFAEYAGASADDVPALLAQDPWFETLAPSLEAHPRATPDCMWMPMENINIIGPTLPLPTDGTTVTPRGWVCGLKPDSELTYRTLHQTNWPGVVDQMARSHCRYWITFLIELGDELLLFTHSEHLGDDHAADDESMANDPVTQRWWSHTQPCLYSLQSEAEPWAVMKSTPLI